MFNACNGSTSARSVPATFQPTIMRENTSITNATYAIPAHVPTYVMSATHNRFGAGAVKSRSTRSIGCAMVGSDFVVNTFFDRATPRTPASFMSRAVWSRPMSHPRSEEHTSELQSRENLVCRLLLEKKKRH